MTRIQRQGVGRVTAGLALLAVSSAAGTNVVPVGAASTNEAENLRAQVLYLSRQLAVSRVEADALKTELNRLVMEQAGGTVPVGPGQGDGGWGDVVVADVNTNLSMVVLSAGAGRGLKPGMTFAVMQGERAVARVRVVDVRRKVAGAVIEDMESSPRARDRVVMMEHPAK